MVAKRRREKEQAEETTDDIAGEGGGTLGEDASVSGDDEEGASDRELPSREESERSVPPDAAVAGAEKALPVAPEVLESFRRQLMRRTFTGHQEALSSLKDVSYEVLRPAVEGLLPEELRGHASLLGSATVFDLGLLAVSLLAAYHQGYAVAQADVLQGYNYHEVLAAELGVAGEPHS